MTGDGLGWVGISAQGLIPTPAGCQHTGAYHCCRRGRNYIWCISYTGCCSTAEKAFHALFSSNAHLPTLWTAVLFVSMLAHSPHGDWAWVVTFLRLTLSSALKTTGFWVRDADKNANGTTLRSLVSYKRRLWYQHLGACAVLQYRCTWGGGGGGGGEVRADYTQATTWGWLKRLV